MISKSIDNRVKLRLGYFFLRADFGLDLKKKTGNLGCISQARCLRGNRNMVMGFMRTRDGQGVNIDWRASDIRLIRTPGNKSNKLSRDWRAGPLVT